MSKPGRNDPCHCGSGAKYKRCCLEKDQLAEREQSASVRTSSFDKMFEPDYTLKECRQLAADASEWTSPLYQLTAEHLVNHMQFTYEPNQIYEALALWRDFSETTSPVFKKIGSYCAALEYMIVGAYGLALTQAELAEKYKVSATTISKNFQALVAFSEAQYGEIDDWEEEWDEDDESEDDADDLPLAGLGGISIDEITEAIQREAEQRGITSEEGLKKLLHEWLERNSEKLLAPVIPKKTTRGRTSDRQRENEKKRQQAEALLMQAEESASPKTRMKLAREALALYPNLVGAYVLLSQHAGTDKAALDLLQQAVEAGENDLGAAFIEENKGHLWFIHEARPYMHAKYTYADQLWRMNLKGDAIVALQSLLALSPQDGLGARELLLTVLLANRDTVEADNLLHQYPDEISAASAYGRFVLAYLKHGLDADELNEPLREALKANPHVPDYLLKRKPLPKQLPEFIGLGDVNEAVYYAELSLLLWQGFPELTQWMAGQIR